MPKIQRLKKRRQFLAAAASGKKHVAKGMVVQARERDPQEPSAVRLGERLALGFTASKKVGNAVARNRAKRRLRAIAQEVLADRPQAAVDLVLIARKETLERDYAKLKQDFQRATDRLLTPPCDPGAPAPGAGQPAKRDA